MKYTVEIEINQPIDKVIELFDNFDNMKLWMKGFKGYKHLEGESGQVGAKTELLYKMGKRDVAMIETITERNLPEVFSGIYEAKGVWNKVENNFKSVAENRTKWTAHQEFKFSNTMMKLMGFFIPGVFKKQSNKYLKDFKHFAENSQ
jgi:uncharacterized membrane protein